jgi:hypothetical protein
VFSSDGGLYTCRAANTVGTIASSARLNIYGTANHTDKKEKKIFLIYKEIQNGAVAKSFMTNGLLTHGEIFAHFPIYEETLPHI